jgi:hypothetical protein
MRQAMNTGKEPRRGRPALHRVRIQLTLSPQIRDALEQVSQTTNITQSQCVEAALTDWIKRQTRRPKEVVPILTKVSEEPTPIDPEAIRAAMAEGLRHLISMSIAVWLLRVRLIFKVANVSRAING